MATVAVVEQPPGDLVLKVNDRFNMGSTATAFAEKRQGHLPLLLHPHPQRALFLGLGTGITFAAAADYAGLTAEGVELVPEVIEMMPHFANDNVGLPDGPAGLTVITGDARRYVRASHQQYDVIVADLFHPGRDGAGWLYTVEHFQAIRDRLAPGGLFCQWLPLYQLDERVLRLIVRTFLAVFPNARAYYSHFDPHQPALALVATLEPTTYPPDWYDQRVVDPALGGALERLGLRNGVQLFGSYVCGPAQLQAFAGLGPLNTDDRPLVIFWAPRYVYQGESPARTHELMQRLLAAWPANAQPPEFADADPAAQAWAERVAAYRAARDEYLRARMAEYDGDQAVAVQHYISAVRASSDFRLGYFVLLNLALQQQHTNRQQAVELLRILSEAHPDRPQARHYLQILGGE